MKKAHNKVLTVIITALLLIGAMPFTVGAQEIYQDLYIPNIDVYNWDDINNTEEISIPNSKVQFKQTVATNLYDNVLFEGTIASIGIAPDDDGLTAIPLDGVVTFAFVGNYKRYKGNNLYDEYEFALAGLMKTVVDKINPNDPFTPIQVAAYALVIYDGDTGNLIDGFYDKNLFPKLSIEQQLFNKQFITDGFVFSIPFDEYEYIKQSEFITIYDYMFVTYEPLFDQYTFRDYMHYESQIISSAQTGIAEWTTNPTVFLVICIIMGVVMIYILLTSLKEWLIGRRY